MNINKDEVNFLICSFIAAFGLIVIFLITGYSVQNVADDINKKREKERVYHEEMRIKGVEDEVDLGKLISFEMVAGDKGGRYSSDVVVKYRVVAEGGTVLSPVYCPDFAPKGCRVMYSASISRVRFIKE